MDNWQTVQNWLVFVPIVGGLAWYYLPRGQALALPKSRDPESTSASPVRRKPERDTKHKPQKKAAVPQPDKQSMASTIHSGGDTTKKGVASKQTPQPVPAAQSTDQDEPDDDLDMSTRQFAQQMQKARQGQQLSGAKSNEKRVKTVKQGSAMDRPMLSSTTMQAGATSKEDTLPASNSLGAGDISDMLEPAAAGPKSLRVTAPSQPQREKVAKQSKKEEVETKKQRQNRFKIEERKLQREAEEKGRKALEERQRRAAREARGEPAKNGVSVAKAPASSAWDAKPENEARMAAESSHEAPLLDTFEAESSSSSNGGPGASTGPSSVDHDGVSEEEQLAHAMQQSVDESGWTTVAIPKKQKKKTGNGEGSGDHTPSAARPVTSTLKVAPTPIKSGAKPTGFQALEDQYTQRTDIDPNDASNWDA